MPNRIQIYIDGGNFHFLALRPSHIAEANFDFDNFVNFIADGREVMEMGKRYYIGSVREIPDDPKSKAVMAEQVRLFNRLKQTSWQIKTSKLRQRRERVIIDRRVQDWQRIRNLGVTEVIYDNYREKGIDVKIATDMIAGAVDSKYDTAIIVSSDTDLVPAIDWIRNRGKKVEYIGFSMPAGARDGTDIRPTSSLINRTDVQRVLVASDITQFLLPQQPIL